MNFILSLAKSSRNIYAVILLITLIGLLCNAYHTNSLLFQRSGALLVCIALGIAYINHHFGKKLEKIELDKIQQSEHEKRMKELTDLMSQFEKFQKSPLNYTQNTTAETCQVPTTFTVEEDIPEKDLEVEYRDERKAYAELNQPLVKAEFIAGTVGTFIWGFGDIFTKYLFLVFDILLRSL